MVSSGAGDIAGDGGGDGGTSSACRTVVAVTVTERGDPQRRPREVIQNKGNKR